MANRVLIVAGSDSGGGAGIQADIKTVTALGGYAATAVTALTAQNTLGVFGVHDVPPAFVAHQMEVVLDDIGADCVKTGMLGNAAVIEAVAGVLARKAPRVPLVVDPVMVAKGGAPLLEPAAVDAVKTVLLPRAFLLTPNLPEAEALLGGAIPDLEAMRRAAAALQRAGATNVLLKGGHLPGPEVHDLLLMADGRERVFSGRRIDTTSTHGTGCTLASAIAAGIAAGLGVEVAVARARDYLRRAITLAPGLGGGHGPLWHGHTVTHFPGGEG